ncbi:winged helix-turn-helix domain-containing protein [Halomicrococcus sp. NG-SE-24]|uniref:winged helix-turn-helix domain-containing protein n=1 Tax=Halomicrococcus sp. NG-SE-24 TaxID=3436928 RepID=UPI003D975CE3
MTEPPDWMRPVDRDILAALERAQPEYVPLLANRLGLHLTYVERRFERLVEHDFVEPVSGEAVYRLTSRGESLLDAEREAE